MSRSCAFPGCGGTFEAKRSDARYCSDTCRAKASKDRARERGGRQGRPNTPPKPSLGARADDPPSGGPHGSDTRLAHIEARLAEMEQALARHDREGEAWRKILARVEASLERPALPSGSATNTQMVAAAVRAAVGPPLAQIRQRLDAVEAEQVALRERLAQRPGARGQQGDGAAQIATLAARLDALERDLKEFADRITEVVESLG